MSKHEEEKVVAENATNSAETAKPNSTSQNGTDLAHNTPDWQTNSDSEFSAAAKEIMKNNDELLRCLA